MADGPWVAVLPTPVLRAGRGGLLGPDTSRRTAWWVIAGSCGHRLERTVRYRPEPGASRGGTQHRSLGDVLPPPRRVRCEQCADGVPAPPAPVA